MFLSTCSHSKKKNLEGDIRAENIINIYFILPTSGLSYLGVLLASLLSACWVVSSHLLFSEDEKTGTDVPPAR